MHNGRWVPLVREDGACTSQGPRQGGSLRAVASSHAVQRVGCLVDAAPDDPCIKASLCGGSLHLQAGSTHTLRRCRQAHCHAACLTIPSAKQS